MIVLSNGHRLEYVVASGALAFDGKGWPWERPLVWAGLIKPELFTVVIKTLTRHPRKGNLRWWKPLGCVRLIRGGTVNKVGLTNPGIEWWCKKISPHLNHFRYPLAGSIYGDQQELLYMAEKLNQSDLVAVEVNDSCPNTEHPMKQTEVIVETMKKLKAVSRHPLIIKLSVAQPYLTIARELVGVAEAVSLNSVPWEHLYPGERSPLWDLQQRVGGGGGGVSGKPAQKHNWLAVDIVAHDSPLPVIGPSVMEFKDILTLRDLGAKAISFGTIHLRTPCKPTKFVQTLMKKELMYAQPKQFA